MRIVISSTYEYSVLFIGSSHKYMPTRSVLFAQQVVVHVLWCAAFRAPRAVARWYSLLSKDKHDSGCRTCGKYVTC